MRRVYADYAATTPLCLPARLAMFNAFDTYGNPSSLHQEGVAARKLVEDARAKVAKAINAEPDEIYFTSGATEANYWIGISVPAITTAIEHKSVVSFGAWIATDRYGISYKLTSPKGLSDYNGAFSVGLVNNEVGTIQPVKSLCKCAREADKNVLFYTDATQAVGHIPVDVKGLDVDFLSMSAHKFGGPKGVGVLFARRSEQEFLRSIIRGGHQEAGKRAGTENVLGIVGMGAAIEWATNNLDKSVPYLTRLRDILIDGILDIPGTELTGHPTQRSPSIASFVFSGIDGQPLVLALDERGVCASSGSACSEGEAGISHVLKAMGYTEETGRGSLRLSIGWNTTEEDVRHIIRAVKESVEELRK